MINLLPPDIKQNIAYARYNKRLIGWCLAFIIAIVGICVVILIGLAYMRQSVNSYTAQVAKGQDQLKIQKLDETQARVQDISNTLKLVTQVLGREILFSKLIQQIGIAIPANTKLINLEIDKIDGGIDLKVAATSYSAATQVQVNVQDPANKIFDKADIVNISCVNSSINDPHYPCTIELRAQFAKNNPFLFINTKATN